MKHLLLTLAAFLLATALWAQRPGQRPMVIQLDPTDTSDKTPTLTIYFPRNPNGTAILECPGGGYTMLSMSHEGHDMANWMNSQGITYAVVQYRMPHGDYTIPIKDAQAAFTQLRTHAQEWHINPDRIGVMGCSAGGHLASTLATHYTEATKPNFQILVYPVITMEEKLTHAGSLHNLLGENPPADLVKEFSNHLQVNAQTPPAFITLSDDDRLVPPENSILYYLALHQNGVKATMHIYPSGGHGWGNMDSFVWKRAWTGELEQWLRSLFDL